MCVLLRNGILILKTVEFSGHKFFCEIVSLAHDIWDIADCPRVISSWSQLKSSFNLQFK